MGVETVAPVFSTYESSAVAVRGQLAATIAQVSAGELVKAFKKTFKGSLAAHRGVWEAVRRVPTADPPFPRCWHRSIHRCRRAIAAGDANDAVGAGVELVLQYPASAPAAFAFDGAVSIAVLSQSGWADRALHGLSWNGGSRIDVEPDGSAARESWRLYRPGYDERRGHGRSWKPAVVGDPLAVARALPRIQRAMELLRTVSPAAASWVSQVTRLLVLVDAPRPDLSVSSSDFARPGEVTLSIPTEIAGLAETFVHECSHQYLHLLELLGPMDTGTDPTLYYSPVKGTGRPIRAILVAFHAFGNVALYYEDVLRRSRSRRARAYCQMHRDKNLDDLRIFAEHLHRSPGLTPLGTALWTPLYERLTSRGLLSA
jgi:HEXXH motif-containing protein